MADNWLQRFTTFYIVLSAGHLGLQSALALIHWAVWRRQEMRRRRPPGAPVPFPSITVVYPIYNEIPEILELVMRKARESLALPQLEVVFVDDGSPNRDELLPVYRRYESERMRVLLPPKNQGKRHAQGLGFAVATGDIIITVDSDTLIDETGIRRLVQPLLERPELGAVTGDVRVQNSRETWLSRLIGLRYWIAFNLERSAQSLGGSMLCCSGPFAAYRRTLVNQVCDDYLNQTFLGVPCTYGDDRNLTNLILRLGYETSFEPGALAYTYVPLTIAEYIPQQTRWNKSFYREMLWTLRAARQISLYSLWDMVLQPVLSLMFTLIIGLVLLRLLVTGDIRVLAGYLAMLVTMSALRALYGLLRTGRPEFLFFVVYGFVHVLILMPVRFKALFTLGDMRWGTRGSKRRGGWGDFALWTAIYWSSALGLAAVAWYGSGNGSMPPPAPSVGGFIGGVTAAWGKALPLLGFGLALVLLLAVTRSRAVIGGKQ